MLQHEAFVFEATRTKGWKQQIETVQGWAGRATADHMKNDKQDHGCSNATGRAGSTDQPDWINSDKSSLHQNNSEFDT